MATNRAGDTDSPDHAACVLDGDRPLVPSAPTAPAVVSPTALVLTFVGDGSPSDGVQIQKLPSPSVDRGDMLQLIGAFGIQIVQCQILPDVERKGSSGCIAKLAGVEHAQRLIDMMHGRELNAILASLGAGAQQAPAQAPPR